MEVNKIKLERVVGAIEQLAPATEADLAQIDTQHGYVRSWGHEGVRYIGDRSLTTVINFIGGQKSDTTDSINVNYGRDFTCEQVADLALAKPGYLSQAGQELSRKQGIEVGNIFQLG